MDDDNDKNAIAADSTAEKSAADEKKVPEDTPAVVETRLKAELLRERMSNAKKSSHHESEALAEKIAHDYFLKIEEEKKLEGSQGSSGDKDADK